MTMKNSIITYLLSFFFLIPCFRAISAAPSNLGIDSLSCLEINGKISNATEGDDGTCLVELLSSNTVVSFATLKDGKKTFRFTLKKNTVYTIKISKRGYLSRLVGIDTKLTEASEDLYSFSFETKLIKTEDSQKLNKEFLDFPIALVYFDPKKECFIYDKEYTTRIKKEIAMK